MSDTAPQMPSIPELPKSSFSLDKQAGLEAIQRIEDDWHQAPDNPLNWSSARKWRMVGIVSFQACLSPLASSVMAPGLPDIGKHYGISSPTILALTLSIYLLAYAIGPLFFGPLSEVVGRRWIINVSNLIFLAFNIACIFASNTSALIAFRFFAGIGASTPLSIGGAVVGDLFNVSERAAASAAYFVGVLLGPPVGPLMGGFIAQSIGFKYGFVLLSSLAGLSTILGLILLRETYTPVIRAKRVNRCIKALESQSVSNLGQEKGHGFVELGKILREKPQLRGVDNPHADIKRLLWTSLVRPIQLLARSSICFILSLYAALIYGYLNMFFTTFPIVFADKYGFGAGATGLTYIGGGVGGLVATFLCGILGNHSYHSLVKRNNGVSKPEFHLPALLPGSITIPIGLLWYGWSAQAGIHWIMPILGFSIFGFGLMAIFLPIQLYFMEAFTYSASALSALAVLRSLFAFVFPLFAPQMIEAMGLGGTYTFLAALIFLIGTPFPIWIYYYGERIRARNPLNN